MVCKVQRYKTLLFNRSTAEVETVISMNDSTLAFVCYMVIYMGKVGLGLV